MRRGGSGVPVRLLPEDFEVVETEALSRSATVLLVDLSMSMPMRDNFVPAKKMAMALQTLISSKFPRDYLGIVGFSEVAREIRPDELPTAMWDYVYGTNLQHALALARRMLAHQHGTKQIIVVTDGEPTAHIDDYGEVHFNYPPVPETLRRTMAEVIRCTRANIVINCFALDLQRTHYPFVEQIARVNGGRTFYTTPDALGATSWSTSSSTAASCAPPAEIAAGPPAAPPVVRGRRRHGPGLARHDRLLFPLAFRDGVVKDDIVVTTRMPPKWRGRRTRGHCDHALWSPGTQLADSSELHGSGP